MASQRASTRQSTVRRRGVVAARQDYWRLQLLKAVRNMALAYIQETVKYKQVIQSGGRCSCLT
jgi:hypothetical protein